MKQITIIGQTFEEESIDDQTPESLAKYLVSLIEYTPGDRFYEPFMGIDNFYKFLPEPKDWAEIKKGRDFFTYLPFDGHCEHIITNSPFRVDVDGKRENSVIISLDRAMKIATKSISFLVNIKMFNAFTPVRLENYKNNGWYVSSIHILAVKKWYGRYFFVTFKKNGKSILDWDINNWD